MEVADRAILPAFSLENPGLIVSINTYSQAFGLARAAEEVAAKYGISGLRMVPAVPRDLAASGMSRTTVDAGLGPGMGWAAPIDYSTNPRGLKESAADLAEQIATRAQQMGGVVLDISTGDESGLRITEEVRERLGFRSNPETSAQRTDKAAMQEALKKANVPYTLTYEVSNRAELIEAVKLVDGPVFIKPTDSANSVGAGRCDTLEEALAFLDMLTTTGVVGALGKEIKSLVVQEVLEGPKWTIDMVSVTLSDQTHHLVTELWAEQVHYTRTVDKETGRVKPGVAWDFSRLATTLSKEALGVVEYTLKVANALGIKEGASCVEVIMTPKGPRLVEAMNRLAGSYPMAEVKRTLGSNQLVRSIEAVIDPESIVNPRPIGRVILSVLQQWLIATRESRIDRSILEAILSLDSVTSWSPGLDSVSPEAVFLETTDTTKSAGFVNLCDFEESVDKAREQFNRLHHRLFIPAEHRKR